MASELQARAAELQKRLGKKATFEEAANELTSVIRSSADAAPADRDALFQAASRAFTLLQTRYGDQCVALWRAGERLLASALELFSPQNNNVSSSPNNTARSSQNSAPASQNSAVASAKSYGERAAHLLGCLARAREVLADDCEAPTGTDTAGTGAGATTANSAATRGGAPFLFEGQLSQPAPVQPLGAALGLIPELLMRWPDVLPFPQSAEALLAAARLAGEATGADAHDRTQPATRPQQPAASSTTTSSTPVRPDPDHDGPRESLVSPAVGAIRSHGASTHASRVAGSAPVDRGERGSGDEAGEETDDMDVGGGRGGGHADGGSYAVGGGHAGGGGSSNSPRDNNAAAAGMGVSAGAAPPSASDGQSPSAPPSHRPVNALSQRGILSAVFEPGNPARASMVQAAAEFGRLAQEEEGDEEDEEAPAEDAGGGAGAHAGGGGGGNAGGNARGGGGGGGDTSTQRTGAGAGVNRAGAAANRTGARVPSLDDLIRRQGEDDVAFERRIMDQLWAMVTQDVMGFGATGDGLGLGALHPDGDTPGLHEAILASLAAAQAAGPQSRPAAKAEVRALRVVEVTEAFLAGLGRDEHGAGPECAVCKDNFVVGEAGVQQMPCNVRHVFHSACLAPWLAAHNSCPVCRHELRTDDDEYERRKARDKQHEMERRGAANALREGEFMYM